MFVLSYVGIALLLFFFQSRLIYYPDSVLVATPSAVGLRFEQVTIATQDGVKLDSWFLPADAARGVLLFFHGNAGNISHRLESLKIFHDLGLSVLIFDYRGYGSSEGKPSEQGTYRDAEAVWRYLTEERGVPSDEIVIFGRSLGASIAAYLAAYIAERQMPGALILESAFTSVPDVAARVYPFLPVRWLARFSYNTHSHLQNADCPVLIVHSPADDVIPYVFGEKLYATAREPKRFLKIRGGHNDGFFVSGQEYIDGLDTFLSAHFDARADSVHTPPE